MDGKPLGSLGMLDNSVWSQMALSGEVMEVSFVTGFSKVKIKPIIISNGEAGCLYAVIESDGANVLNVIRANSQRLGEFLGIEEDSAPLDPPITFVWEYNPTTEVQKIVAKNLSKREA